ncbi:hypothetical protein N9L48_04750 [Psychrosphaera sp.]|nr:hypothetical protein [Psychrosphaera sp.]
MKYFKVLIIVAISLFVLGNVTEKMFWELDLGTGIARAEYTHLGIQTSTITLFRNPKSCPTWTPPQLAMSLKNVSYSCYFHFNTESCARDVRLYNKAYNEGCGT